jgi:hypothetical protein
MFLNLICTSTLSSHTAMSNCCVRRLSQGPCSSELGILRMLIKEVTLWHRVQSSTECGCSSVYAPWNFQFRGTRISALPKGLISWFLGHQYPGSVLAVLRSRIHQIPPHSPFRSHQVRRPRRSARTSRITRDTNFRSIPLVGIRLGVVFSSGYRARLATMGTGNLNDSFTKTNRQEKNPHRFVFDQDFPRVKVALKPSDEGSLSRLRNPFLRDRMVQWNRQRNYHVHPYWTDNLKYVC